MCVYHHHLSAPSGRECNCPNNTISYTQIGSNTPAPNGEQQLPNKVKCEWILFHFFCGSEFFPGSSVPAWSSQILATGLSSSPVLFYVSQTRPDPSCHVRFPTTFPSATTLSVTSLIYDPLCFLYPFTPNCCYNSWDNDIPQSLSQQWQGWRALTIFYIVE